MASGNEVFEAKIVAKDESSKTVSEIAAKVDHLGQEYLKAGKSAEHLHQAHAHAFFGMSEHVHLLRHEMGGLTASFGEAGSKVSELLPALAAFGAAASLEGVFENIDRTAEAFSKLHHEAVNAGTSMQNLLGLHFAAALSDTSTEAMDSALMKLNKTLGTIAHGGAKDAAAGFRAMHIALKDAHGNMRSAADILPQLADVMKRTVGSDGKPNNPQRNKIATTMMGKGGGEMIDFLSQGGDNIRAAQKDFAHIGFTPTDEQQESLERYHKAMIRMQTSASSAMQAFGTAAAPAVQPILDGTTDFLTKHREEVSATIAKDLKPVENWIEGGGLDRALETMKHIAKDADDVAQFIGGWGHAAEFFLGVLTVKGGFMLFKEPIEATIGLSKAIGKLSGRLIGELVPAWGEVGTAAATAGETEAAAAGGAAGLGARGLLRLLPAVTLPLALKGDTGPNTGLTQWNLLNNPGLAGEHGLSGNDIANLPVGEDTQLHLGERLLGLFGSRPSDFPRDRSYGGDDSRIQVDVNLSGAPFGTTASVRSSGSNLLGPRINIANTGRAWDVPF